MIATRVLLGVTLASIAPLSGTTPIESRRSLSAPVTTARWRMTAEKGAGTARFAGIWSDEIVVAERDGRTVLVRPQEEVLKVSPELFPAAAARGLAEIIVRRLTEADARTLLPLRSELKATTGLCRAAIFSGSRFRYEEATRRPGGAPAGRAVTKPPERRNRQSTSRRKNLQE